MNSYRKANKRLRKMGRQELDDVTSQRLKMRPDIEKEIDSIVIGCGFRRVSFTSADVDNGSREHKNDDAITTWNRHMHLYERIG